MMQGQVRHPRHRAELRIFFQQRYGQAQGYLLMPTTKTLFYAVPQRGF